MTTTLRKIILAGCAIALAFSPGATLAGQAWTDHAANLPPMNFVCENLHRQIVKLNIQPANKLLQVQDQNGNIIDSYVVDFSLGMNMFDAFGQPLRDALDHPAPTYYIISAMSRQYEPVGSLTGPVAGLSWEAGGWVFFWHHDGTDWKCLEM